MRKRTWFVSLSVAIGLLSAVPSAYSDEVMAPVGPVLTNSTVNQFTQQIQSNPSAANYLGRAEALRRLGMRKEAIDDLNQALSLEPNNVATKVLSGQVYFEDGMLPESISNLDAAIKMDPKFEASYALRGRSYLKLKDYNKAIADANKLLELNPKSPLGFLLRGAAYNGSGKYSNAIDDLNAAINADPKMDKAYYWRAEAYQNSEQYEKSVNDYLQAIKLQPNYRPAYLGLAWSYYKLGKNADALKYCSNAIAFHDAVDLMALNEYEGDKASDAGPGADPEYNLGSQIEEDLKNCVVLYDDILKDKPGDPDALRGRGIAYMHLSKYREAMKDFEDANKGLPVNPKDFSGLGSADGYNAAIPDYKQGNQDFAKNDYASAITHYQAALKKYPQYGRCWHNLALAYAYQRDFFTAELCAVHSVSYRPDDWKLWDTLGYVLYHEFKADKGDPKKLSDAVQALHQSLALKPDSTSDKNDVLSLLTSVKNYQRSLTPVIDFQITTMPVN